MAFSEKIKLEVKKRAAFQCCRCRAIGVQVHHIITSEGDTIDNAAPLCPSCHDYFGENPKKRKEIRQMRDWWYEVCDEKYKSNNKLLEELEKINNKIESFSENLDSKKLKEEILKEFTERITNQNINTTDLLNRTSEGLATATRLGSGVYGNFRCKKCNTAIGLLIGSDRCPNCGEIIE